VTLKLMCFSMLIVLFCVSCCVACYCCVCYGYLLLVLLWLNVLTKCFVCNLDCLKWRAAWPGSLSCCSKGRNLSLQVSPCDIPVSLTVLCYCCSQWTWYYWSILIYRVFPKSKPLLKLFDIFSHRLSLFAWNFAHLLAVHIHIYLPIFVDLS